MERRLLIVHQSADLYGSDLSCLYLARAARAAGWRVDVIVPGNGPLVGALEEAGAGVHQLDPLVLRRSDLRSARAFFLPLKWVRNLLALRGFARTQQFDLIHSNCAPTLGGALLSRWMRVPHVWHVREIFGQSPALLWIFERVLATADLVIPVSRAAADQFRSPALRAKCRVVYTGAAVPTGTANRDPLTREVVELICVGRLNGWKGQGVLIEAVHELRARGHRVHLTLVGSEFGGKHKYEPALRHQISTLGLEKWVTLLGERRDALSLTAEADIAVVPSTRPEPFGMTVVEAMALGRAVVVSDAGGPAEIVRPGRDGLLVPPGDVKALAQAIAHLIEHPTEAKLMAVSGRERAAQFSIEQMTTQVLRLGEDLLAVGRSANPIRHQGLVSR